MKKYISICILIILAGVLPVFAGELKVEDLTVFRKAVFSGSIEFKLPESSTNGLVLYHSYSSNSTYVADFSGAGNTGTVYGATWISNGVSGGAFSYDGINDYIGVPHASSLNLTTALTVSAWVMATAPADVDGWDGVVCKGNFSNRNYDLQRLGNRIATVYVSGGVGRWNLTSTNNICDGQWHHVITTWNGSNVYLYVDGQDAVDYADPNNYGRNWSTPLVPTTDPLWIGRISSQTSYPFQYFNNGAIDEVMIYNRALSPDEVLVMYLSYRGATNAGQVVAVDIVSNNRITQNSSAATNIFMGKVGLGTGTPDAGSMLDVAGNMKVQGTNVVGALSLGGQTRTNWPAGAETWAQYPASTDVSAGNRTVTVGNLIVNNTATFNNSISLVGTTRTDNTTGMVLFYNFASNTNVIQDLSGYGHAGSVSGATWTANGKTNGAYSFDATNDWIQTPSTVALSPTNQLTIMAWIKLDTAISNTYPMIVTKNPSSGAATYLPGNYEFRVNNNGVLYFQSQYTTNASQSASGVSRVDNLAWHMVGVTVDAPSKLVRLYVDGRLDKSQVMANRPIAFTNAEPVRIGRRKDGYYYDGLIDEVRMYNRALTPEEMTQVYAFYMQEKNTAVLTADRFTQTGFTQTNVFMGNVGIGTNMATNALSVAGTASATFFVGNGSMLTSLAGGNIANASISGSKLANLTITSNQIANGTITTGKLHLASVDARYVNTSGDTMNGTLQLPANGLRVNSNQLIAVSGKVGIGTNNPTEKLHVAGNLRVDGKVSMKNVDSSIVLSGNDYIAAGGNYATIVGYGAGTTNIVHDYATFLGAFAGFNSINSTRSIFGGYAAGASSSNCDYSTIYGPWAGEYATNCTSSIMQGYAAGYGANFSQYPIFIGYQAGKHSFTNMQSVFVGYSAGENVVNSMRSIFIGSLAGMFASNNTSLIGIGPSVAGSTFNDVYSVFIGSSAGSSTTNCKYNVFIGCNAGKQNQSVTNSVALGAYTKVDADNTVVLGNHADVVVGGTCPTNAAIILSKTGAGQFNGGISYVAPLGDISMGSYTNKP